MFEEEDYDTRMTVLVNIIVDGTSYPYILKVPRGYKEGHIKAIIREIFYEDPCLSTKEILMEFCRRTGSSIFEEDKYVEVEL